MAKKETGEERENEWDREGLGKNLTPSAFRKSTNRLITSCGQHMCTPLPPGQASHSNISVLFVTKTLAFTSLDSRMLLINQ